MVWIPCAEDEKQRFDELAALYFICRKRLQEINTETQMVASSGSVAHRDEQSLLSHNPPVPDQARHLITFTAQSYLHAASEHLGALGTLYAHQEVLLSPVVLARCVIEHAAHAVWILGGKSKTATDRLSRAYLEEVDGAEHAKQQAGDLFGKQSNEYKLRAGHYREVKNEAKALFPEPHQDEHGRPMYRGEQLPSPEAAVVHLNRVATRPLSDEQMKGTYGLLGEIRAQHVQDLQRAGIDQPVAMLVTVTLMHDEPRLQQPRHVLGHVLRRSARRIDKLLHSCRTVPQPIEQPDPGRITDRPQPIHQELNQRTRDRVRKRPDRCVRCSGIGHIS